MHPRFLQYYERELEFIREMGREFAKAYPKIGARLDLDGFECADPYVERLLEGFAFLTGRIQLKLDAEFPQFTQHLLELLYPNHLAPVPSMAVVEFRPDTEGAVPPEGQPLPRGTRLFATAADAQRSRVELRTGANVDLRPLQVAAARYVPAGGLDKRIAGGLPYRAALHIELQTLGEIPISALEALEALVFFLAGSGRTPWRVHEALHAHTHAIRVRVGTRLTTLDSGALSLPGLRADEALLPVDERVFGGYRLLQEYFGFPERFRFFRLGGLQRALGSEGPETSFSVTFLLDREYADLEGKVEAAHFALHCAPAINLFPRRCDRIRLTPASGEYRVVVDRTRPQSFEVHSIQAVEGYGEGPRPLYPFHPFYHSVHRGTGDAGRYYTVQRRPRLTQDPSGYITHDVYLAVVDEADPPFSDALRQLGVQALCTNRDLCQRLRLGDRMTDFHLDTGAPVSGIRVLAGPSRPRATPVEGEYAWRLISHLNLNYQPLTSLEALRALLNLYADARGATRRHAEGLVSVKARGIVRRLPGEGPLTYAPGTEVVLGFERERFEGQTPYLLGRILATVLRHYASINSFVETRIEDTNGEPIATISAGLGRRPVL